MEKNQIVEGKEILVTRTLKQYKKTCQQCKKQFVRGAKAKYCSVDCNRKANYARHRDKYLERQRTAYQEHGPKDRESKAKHHKEKRETAGKGRRTP